MEGFEIKAAREEMGLTLKELAERLDYHFTTVHYWEKGTHHIRRSVETKIRELLDAHRQKVLQSS